MLDNIFDTNELPNFKVYEAAHKAVDEYMKKTGLSIGAVAANLNTTSGVAYRRLNPKDTQMPMSVDFAIAIAKLTGDNRIIESINNELDLVAIPKKEVKPNLGDLNLLVDIANIENNDVFRTVKLAIGDKKLTDDEIQDILKEIEEAEKANAELKDTVLKLAKKEE
ncbi:phage regulatory CII family protein [Poseidonibacter lekithochrous]|uniref:phage regulatory CII family protein n=1 Tax=Poseidonibacter lekithochrous TaxID=1904463 RepID=UPI000D3D8236|nr:phage regulatory CII family protein [Poseidonibacter lekithochrous]